MLLFVRVALLLVCCLFNGSPGAHPGPFLLCFLTMDAEQLAQEAAIWPWLDDDSMADPPEDYYLPPEEAYLDDCFNDGPESDLWDCF